MDINSKFSKANDGVLAAPTELSGDKAVLIDNVGIVDPTGWPTDTPVHIAIYKLKTDGTLDPATLTFWKAILIGSTLTDMQITGGVNQPYTNGDICVIQPTAGWANDLVSGILAQHNQDGTHSNVTTNNLSVSGSLTLPAQSVPSSAIQNDAVTPEKRSGGFYQIRHTFDNATGAQTITGVPFKPKAIIVHGGVQSNVAVIISHGMATDGSPIVQSSSGAASTTSSAGTSSATTRAFVRSSTSGTVTFGATVTGFTADGITVNVGTASAIADDRTYDIMFMG